MIRPGVKGVAGLIDPLNVMAVLVPAVSISTALRCCNDRDARDKPGHDESRFPTAGRRMQSAGFMTAQVTEARNFPIRLTSSYRIVFRNAAISLA